MNIMSAPGQYGPQTIIPQQLTEGINLSKKEFASAGIVVRNIAKKTGEGKYTDESVLVNEFKSQMRQVFDVRVLFEELKPKDSTQKMFTKIIACRFAKKRPLIYLVYETENKSWFVLDEKRFDPFSLDGCPFLGVNI